MAFLYEHEAFRLLVELLGQHGNGVQPEHAAGHFLRGRLAPEKMAEAVSILRRARKGSEWEGVYRASVGMVGVKLNRTTGDAEWWWRD